MAYVDSRDYVLSRIYYSVSVQNKTRLVNIPSKHDFDPVLAHRLRRCPSIKPALVQRLVFAGLRSIAAGPVLLTAGGDNKLTPT